jgi:hypothetical protein
MRAASADRERAVDLLKAGFAEGRLDQDEYADRVGRAYAARTYGDLAAITDDLPAGPLGTLAAGPAVAPLATPAPYVPALPQKLSPVNVAAGTSAGLVGATALLAILVGSSARSDALVVIGAGGAISFLLAIVGYIGIARTGERGLGLASVGFILGGLAMIWLMFGTY